MKPHLAFVGGSLDFKELMREKALRFRSSDSQSSGGPTLPFQQKFRRGADSKSDEGPALPANEAACLVTCFWLPLVMAASRTVLDLRLRNPLPSKGDAGAVGAEGPASRGFAFKRASFSTVAASAPVG